MAQGQALQQQLLYTKCLLSYCPGHTTLLCHALFSFSQVLIQVGDPYTISGEHRHQTTFVGVVMEINSVQHFLACKSGRFYKMWENGWRPHAERQLPSADWQGTAVQPASPPGGVAVFNTFITFSKKYLLFNDCNVCLVAKYRFNVSLMHILGCLEQLINR